MMARQVTAKGDGGSNSRPVRVLFLEKTLNVGGAERVLVNLIQSFDRSRVQPSVVLLRDSGKMTEQLETADVPIYHNLGTGKCDPRMLGALTKVIRKECPDVIYTCNYPMTMFYGRLAGFLAGVNTHVVALHTIGYIRRPTYRALSLKLMRPFIARLVAVSEGQKSYYSKVHGLDASRIEVIHVGIDLDRFSPDQYDRSAKAELMIPEEAQVVGIVAVLRPEKKHELFLRMAQIVLSSRKDVYFLVVGDGPERSRLESIARELGIAECVRFAGSRSDVPWMLRAFDVSVLCSGRVVETFPQSLVESMAMELPIVSTDVGSIDELVVDGVSGFLTPEGDAEALADRILHLLNHPDMARELGRAGRRRVEDHFSKEIMVRRFEELFQRLISDRQLRRTECPTS